jgi:hypothetical protein
MVIAHPPCTYLCNSGVRWLYKGGAKRNGIDPERWVQMEAAVAFYDLFRKLKVERVAIENPVMHSHALLRLRMQKYDVQFVQPWWFGEPFFKATGFNLKGLPRLKPTNKLVPPKKAEEPDRHREWSKVHYASPGADRWAERSATFPGIADACAERWG